jgi:hypothetical protein
MQINNIFPGFDNLCKADFILADMGYHLVTFTTYWLLYEQIVSSKIKPNSGDIERDRINTKATIIEAAKESLGYKK